MRKEEKRKNYLEAATRQVLVGNGRTKPKLHVAH